MRLLEYDSARSIRLTNYVYEDSIPPYAILSHTWGNEDEEVKFADIINGTGTAKPAYQKIEFCKKQAIQDGLRHFWVDTCCINKADFTELSEAFNSMFRWYHNAATCYVYLSDISQPNLGGPDNGFWEGFQKSRWFTRGWTLQELLAPTSVEFFSKEGKKIGDKKSLEPYICEATGIPVRALRGSLSTFPIQERRSWQNRRQTTRKEDKAYSLLGVCGVNMTPLYGEGEASAFNRLQCAIDNSLKGTKRGDFSVALSLSGVPETQNFVAREVELQKIHEALGGDGTRHAVSLHGLGGIGKTQLAIAYAKRHKDGYSAIFLVNAKDEDSLKQSFATIAKRILRHHPSAKELCNIDLRENLDNVFDAVSAWLSLPDNTRWLIIYDNYDDPEVNILKFIPEAYQGSVVVTTRLAHIRLTCDSIHIRRLENTDDSLTILSNTSRRQITRDDPSALKLSEELDGLPLALATAGAFLSQVTMSISNYLRLYQTAWSDLQKTSPNLTSYDGNRTLYSPWRISFEQVKRESKLAAGLLHLWAYFDNQDLWYELIKPGGFNELQFHNSMRVLCNYELAECDQLLLEVESESEGYSIHSCVHQWTTHVLNDAWDPDLVKLAIWVTALHIPGGESEGWWLIQRRILRHATRCLYSIDKGTISGAGLESELHQLGGLFLRQDKFEEAEKMYQRALRGREKALGPDHTSTLDLGNLYLDQSKFEEAEKMYQRALRGREKALGPDHTSTLSTVNNLGNLYKNQGKFEEAEKMYQRALRGREKALDPGHTSTLDTVHNLGDLYLDQGKFEEAEKMYQRALRGKEKALGPDHTSTLDTVHNLGSLYLEQGKFEEAENMFQRALRGRDMALGPDHTSTLDTVNNLGNLYKNQGKVEEGAKMFWRAMEVYGKAFPDRPSTLSATEAIESLYKLLEKFVEAEAPQEAPEGIQKPQKPRRAPGISISSSQLLDDPEAVEDIRSKASDWSEVVLSSQSSADDANKAREPIQQAHELQAEIPRTRSANAPEPYHVARSKRSK